MSETTDIPEELPLGDEAASGEARRVAGDTKVAAAKIPTDGIQKNGDELKEETPVIDVHDAHHAASSWREFFVHIATIVLGLLIAVGLEQTVEYFHRRHEAREARENIQQEMATNLPILQFDQQEADADQRQFGKDLDLLESGASDAVVLHNLEFGGIGTRPHDAAWDAAKVNGSLALIPPGEIAGASYYYESEEELTPTVFAFFADIYTAEALLDHARTAGKLTASERQQLLSLTVSAMGHGQLISQMDSRGIQALQTSKLQ